MNWLDQFEEEIEAAGYQIEEKTSIGKDLADTADFVTDQVEEARSYVLRNLTETIYLSAEIGRKDGYPILGLSAEIQEYGRTKEIEEAVPVGNDRPTVRDLIPAL